MSREIYANAIARRLSFIREDRWDIYQVNDRCVYIEMPFPGYLVLGTIVDALWGFGLRWEQVGDIYILDVTPRNNRATT